MSAEDSIFLESLDDEFAVLSNGEKKYISRRKLKNVRETALKAQRRTLI